MLISLCFLFSTFCFIYFCCYFLGEQIVCQDDDQYTGDDKNEVQLDNIPSTEDFRGDARRGPLQEHVQESEGFQHPYKSHKRELNARRTQFNPVGNDYLTKGEGVAPFSSEAPGQFASDSGGQTSAHDSMNCVAQHEERYYICCLNNVFTFQSIRFRLFFDVYKIPWSTMERMGVSKKTFKLSLSFKCNSALDTPNVVVSIAYHPEVSENTNLFQAIMALVQRKTYKMTVALSLLFKL